MIRVLHLFSPTFGRSFSGDNKWWVRAFQKWTDERVTHQVAFVEQGMIVDARTIKDAFGQKNSGNSANLPRWRRAVWALSLLLFLAYRRRNYDIIHIHTDFWGALLAGPLGRLLGRPCICHIVRMGEDDPTTLERQSFGHLKLWCFKQYRRVICISEALRQECLRQGLSEGQSLTLINPVDSDVFSPGGNGYTPSLTRIKLDLPEKGRIILSVGSIIPRKGMDLLVEAFSSLAGDFPDVCLVLVGPASQQESSSVDEDFVSGLRQKIAEAGLAGRVIFTGRIDEDATLADYYRAGDIFAFPTRQEGLGNVLLEAMAAGLPVVATHLPGITDMLVQNDKTGFLIPMENVATLKGRMQYLLDHPERGRELGGEARKYALRHFGFTTWQMNLSSIYSSLLDKKNPGNHENS